MEAVDSPIWDASVRDMVTLGKCPDAEINQRRSKNLVPGTPLELTETESRVPVLLVHQPGCRETPDFGAGWDMILPAGWGK